MLNTKVDKILYRYNDALYCAAMLGGESGVARARGGLESFKQELTEAARDGLSADESKVLLDRTIMLNSEAFLFALKTCGNFTAFSNLLDRLSNDVNTLRQPQQHNDARMADFLRTVLGCDTRRLPEPELYDRYVAMRDLMLAQSSSPNASVMSAIIDDFANIRPAAAEAEASYLSQCTIQ